jgi:hypothetical protein
VIFIVRAIDDRGHAPDWTPIPFGQKCRYHSMATMKCGIG